MKKTITLGAHFGSLFVFLLATDAPMWLLRFIMAGELPGGMLILSADAMLTITGLMLSIVVLFLLVRVLSHTKIPSAVTQHLPKRRYTAIQ